jgi:hypothetical protein
MRGPMLGEADRGGKSGSSLPGAYAGDAARTDLACDKSTLPSPPLVFRRRRRATLSNFAIRAHGLRHVSHVV